MTVLKLPVQMPLDDLVEIVAQLPEEDLNDFMTRVNLFRQRQATEEALLAAIRQRLPDEQRERLSELRDKLEAETLTETERAELLALVEQVEDADVERAKALLALAQKRGVSVRQLMIDLGLEPHLA
jgi:helix-turn-helix protein